jgi:hypothetical protein
MKMAKQYMTIDELKDIAKENNIYIPYNFRKDDMIDLINEFFQRRTRRKSRRTSRQSKRSRHSRRNTRRSTRRSGSKSFNFAPTYAPVNNIVNNYYTVPQIKEIAKVNDIDVPSKLNKDDLLLLINSILNDRIKHKTPIIEPKPQKVQEQMQAQKPKSPKVQAPQGQQAQGPKPKSPKAPQGQQAQQAQAQKPKSPKAPQVQAPKPKSPQAQGLKPAGKPEVIYQKKTPEALTLPEEVTEKQELKKLPPMIVKPLPLPDEEIIKPKSPSRTFSPKTKSPKRTSSKNFINKLLDSTSNISYQPSPPSPPKISDVEIAMEMPIFIENQSKNELNLPVFQGTGKSTTGSKVRSLPRIISSP